MSTMSEAAEAGPSLPPAKRLHLMGEEECAEVGDTLLEKSPTEEKEDQHMEDEEDEVQHMDEEEIDPVDSDNTHLELHDIERVNMQALNVARAFVTCKVRDMGDSGSIKTFQCRVHFRVHGLAVEQARLKTVAGGEIVNDSIEEDEKPKMATPFDVDKMEDHNKYIQLVKESAGYHCGLSKYHEDNQMSERERIKFDIFVWEPLKGYKDKQGYDCRPFKGSFLS
ncbi:hypothetical protein CRG98_020387 [Punica granatum]|uniref:Uncharacterized protein n=1 Tax=Punica granatum TaxID=22663 RepID=A0A2I0JSF0_PUNGR|nr:hypothetical protein CRG98_020387 [Punica granatum]